MATTSTSQDTAVKHPKRVLPWLPICLMLAGIVVMAITSFLHLIKHEPPIWLMAMPPLAGFVGAAMMLNDRRFAWENRLVWAAGLVFAGLAAVALAGVLILHVLPLH
ncbi:MULTISPECIES: hypothetical protein [unclassified Luteococcus]|uniref:hypothetical protein n=1 Tax=unclassified Luteococcus TaxID=2639923 RepID=UPI00313BF4D8